MISFESDYIAGAHEKIIQRLVETNMETTVGYGCDQYTAMAKEKIKACCKCEDGDVYLLVGGTQTNMTVISSMLRPFEGVISAHTGHVATHESGAIESTGHKVLCLDHVGGKLDSKTIDSYIKSFYADESFEHMVYPGMVYISYPTEYGTLYSKKEVQDIYSVCQKYEIPLFIDGARLGYGLMSKECDMTIEDIAKYCDVFYIGGTKVGALFGEAVVFTKNNTPKQFFTMIKQKGALLAKGRLLGIQFDTLFTDDLYFKISAHAIEMANILKENVVKKGYTLFLDSPTNQQFVIMDNKKIEELRPKVSFSTWEVYDETHTVIRFATSWSTSIEDITALISML